MGIEQNISTQTKQKLKKYLFLISILFFIGTSFHLLYNYLYSDAKLIPIKGGTVSEGIIGDFPSLNPLEQSTGNNAYFMELLYRSLLKYNIQEDKIDSDITQCDISNLSKIECFINTDVKWSNGENITTQDIEATYNLLKDSSINPVISSLLEDVTITSDESSIVFEKSENDDINFLNIFFQPILSVNTLNNIGKDNLGGNFSTIGQIYSGKFKITNVQQDNSLGITKFVLEKNEFYFENPVYIDQLIIKLFPDTNTFNKNKETINIFQDNNNLIGSSLPRFDINEYKLPQYVSVFLNKETLQDIDFRNTILNKIDRENLLKVLGVENVSPVINPYMGEYEIDKEIENKNYENIISKYGYKRKSQLIQQIIPEKKPQEFYSAEITLEDLPENLTFDDFQKDSDIIISPEYVDRYNSIQKDDILLTGLVKDGVTAVYINDYKLQGFTPGDSRFNYRLRESYDNISEGVNNYEIFYESDGEKESIELLTFIYNPDSAKLKREEDTFLQELYKDKIRNEREQLKIEEENRPEINQERLDTLSKLNDTFFYNDDYERLTLDLFYVASDRDIEKSATFIKNNLEEIGIYVELYPTTVNSLISVISNKDQYDIILAGIDLGYFDHNIFPYFHSSQVKSGYNFSNIKKALLDNNLKELKESLHNKERSENIEGKILDILKEEQVVKTLYTPTQKLIVDKNINTDNFPELLKNKSLRAIVYNQLYINDKKILNLNDKNISGFVKYIIEIL